MSEQTEYAYDVFISYSHQDEERVTGMLLPRLEEAGLRVCIDFRDFVAGKPALLNMQDAALGAPLGHRRRPAGLYLQSGLRRSRGAPAADGERISGSTSVNGR